MFASSSQRFLRMALPAMNVSQISQRQATRLMSLQTRNSPAFVRWSNNNLNQRHFASVLRGKNSVKSKKTKKQAMKMQAATLVPDAVAVLKEAEGTILKTSLGRTKELAESVGVRLTPNELTTLQQKLADTTKTRISDQMETLSQRALSKRATREICLSVICSSENKIDKLGVQVISFFDYLGTALFAVVGAQVAGDAGMNLVGCTLVGCAAAMGGGSLNALLYGGTNPLLGTATGVRWVTCPSFLVTAMVASMVTFFLWPYYCKTQANRYIEDAIGKENINESDTIGLEAFLYAWHHNPRFQQCVRDALPNLSKKQDYSTLEPWMILRQGLEQTLEHTLEQTRLGRTGLGRSLGQKFFRHDHDEIDDGITYFDYIDNDSSGDIDRDELQKLVQHRFYNGWETYWLETFGLTSLSMAAVRTAIRCGLSPIVAATSGVTVCFGGIIRDILVGRDIKFGSQSYAFATGATSATYIFLRELTIRRMLVLPLVVRTFMSAGACVALRGYEFWTGQPILRPMHT